MDLAALLLGLVAAISLGLADFSGGAAARSGEPAAVAAWTWGAVGVAGLVIGPLGSASFRASVVGWGILGGMLAAIGSTALFYGIANARVAIVAPLSAVTGASVPVVVDALGGSEYGGTVIAGIVVALLGVVMTTWSGNGDQGRLALSIATGLGAGFALALLFVVTAKTLDDGVWVIGPVGLSAFAFLAGASLATGRAMQLSGSAMRWTVAAGVGTAIAYPSFLLSAAESSFGMAAVVTSLYPAVTVLAAMVVWRERPAMIQRAGLVVVVAALALIGGG